MNKQPTPLEALHNFDHWIQVEFAEQFKIIETTLKDYEQLKIVAKPLTNEEKKSINSVAKRLKALEIIKEKRIVFIFDIEPYENYDEYFGDYQKAHSYISPQLKEKLRLTQEEFDLLKEVLK